MENPDFLKQQLSVALAPSSDDLYIFRINYASFLCHDLKKFIAGEEIHFCVCYFPPFRQWKNVLSPQILPASFSDPNTPWILWILWILCEILNSMN